MSDEAKKVNPADYADRPIGDLLDALGVKEDPKRAKELRGTTTLRFAPRRKKGSKSD